ncbi:RNA recognition motif domain-containing protein [Alkalilimnicola sp. S0819]|uniref:RNA recognition motif domain-containing protein n=1 Tax=Alkalilimnicola sp. S0819 TaxID=2613922 RepID=UPI001261E318|nr:RNA-binding protein [Alkalilimnicola sp. S0819]KAB7627766.1 RNA-binding protein [Alkalilimnicola sp. S0819]MPQ15390.1 RNA-binding protein [Alkalilimnicola sp. S0819]
MTSIYVGNLPFTSTEDELRDLFGEFGEVESVRLINDRDTGRPRGFGFVQMPADAAEKAIAALNGQNHGGRDLRVNEAEDKPRRPAGGGGGRW